MSEFISVSRNGGILEIILDKPKVNAICAATSRELGQVYAAFRDDPELRVAIFSCAGDGIFSAGWDLKAAEQGELGLVNEVVAPGQAMDGARRLADELTLGAPLALAAIKQVVQLSQQMSLEQYYQSMYDKAWPALDQALNSEDFDEDINAFMEKRDPNWKGR